jgi:methionyl-tRNA formyltransferase
VALRIVVLGTGEFAVPAFRALMESEHQVVAAYTQPDRTGRGHHRHVNVVKVLAEQHQVPVYQPQNINLPAVLDELRDHNADVFIVAAYGQILKRGLLEIPRLGAFNLHGSLLPRHRGAAPVQYSIWKGDQETGVTIFQIERALDSGPVVGSVSTPIGKEETSGELMLRLAELCVPLTLQVVHELEAGTAQFVRQDEDRVTLAPRIQKHDGIINWSAPASDIECQIRAMQPWPRAVTWLTGPQMEAQRFVLLAADAAPAGISAFSNQPGAIQCSSGRLAVMTGSGPLEILRLQLDGRKPVQATAFLNGFTLPPDATFTASPE